MVTNKLKLAFHIIFLVLNITLLGCKQETKTVVAIINDTIKISLNQVDNRIQNELYDDLHKIYLRREKSLNEIIDEIILECEAKREGKSKKELLEQQLFLNNNEDSLLLFKKKNAIGNSIPYYNNFLTSISLNTKLGKQLLDDEYNIYILKNYLTVLRNKYNVKTMIEPPLSPIITLDSLQLIHFKGNLSSKTTFLIISDVECPTCREATPIFQDIYEKFKTKVKFAYVSYSGIVNVGIKALESADNQDKYWPMYDTILSNPTKIDTLNYMQYAAEMELNPIIFKNDLTDSILENRLLKNFEYLQCKGIYATPTIVLNSRIIPDVFNKERIILEIEKQLRKED